MTDIEVVSEADHVWAIEKMDFWHGAVLDAFDTAKELASNWTEGRNVHRFFDQPDLRDALRARYPDLSANHVNRMFAAAEVAIALPAETAGMSPAAIKEVGGLQPEGRPKLAGKRVSDPAKVEQAKKVLTEARKVAGDNPPTAKQVRTIKQGMAQVIPSRKATAISAPKTGGMLPVSASKSTLLGLWSAFRAELNESYHEQSIRDALAEPVKALNDAIANL